MSKPWIMQVDDDENDIFLLESAFRKVGIKNPIRVVTDGQAAIDYLAGEGEYADRVEFPLPLVVLLDLKVPRRSGLEVLEWIRSQPHLRGLTVIVFTSSPGVGDVQRAYELGANSFVIKPADIQQLRTIAQSLHSWWLEINCYPPDCSPTWSKDPS